MGNLRRGDGSSFGPTGVSTSHGGLSTLRKLVFPRFIEVHEVIQPLSHWLPSARLDPGESDAIALTLQLGAALLLIDERKGRHAASQLGLRFSGILGILVAAKQKSLITNVRVVIERLRKEAGFFLSEAHLKQTLDQVGE